MHANTYFWIFLCCMKIQYDFFIFEWLGQMQEYIYIYIYISMFWWKLSILISNLYLYSIKIQTNAKQNSAEKYTGKSQIF